MKTYLTITITYYSNHDIAPRVYYYRDDGKAIFDTQDKLTVDEANRLMWELVKLGAENHYESNPYRPTICTRKVTFWGSL